jgi:hypothetical protein
MVIEETVSDEEVIDEKASLVQEVVLGKFDPGSSVDEKRGINGHEFRDDSIHTS